ncbi:unnamed protein product, partial [Amoebophrya sp. A120]
HEAARILLPGRNEYKHQLLQRYLEARGGGRAGGGASTRVPQGSTPRSTSSSTPSEVETHALRYLDSIRFVPRLIPLPRNNVEDRRPLSFH